MPRFPEQKLWDRIRKNIDPSVHIERLENSAGVGTPDTLIIYRGIVTLAEHKSATAPAKSSTRVQWSHPLKPQQRNWHRMWTQNGGRSCIVVRVDLDIHCLPGRMADEITDMPCGQMSAWRVDYIALTNIYKGIVKL